VTRVMFVIILCLKNGLVFKTLAQDCFWVRYQLAGLFCPFIHKFVFGCSVLCHVIVHFFPHSSSIFYFYFFIPFSLS